MKITLKNLKHSEFASHETHCFEATVYVDGKRAFLAENSGQGGCNSYSDNKAVQAINAELSKETISFGEGHTIENDLDIVIGNLVNDMLVLKDLKKSLKKKVLFTEGEGLYQIGYKGSRKPDQALIDHVKKENPNAVILNCLAIEEALQFFKEAA